MFIAKSGQRLLTYSMRLAGLIILVVGATSSASQAQDQSAYVRLVREIETGHLIVPHPAGLAFSPQANMFFVLPGRGATQAAADGDTLAMVTPLADPAGSLNLPLTLAAPINMTFDNRANRLLLLDAAANQLIEIRAGLTGELDPATPARFDVRPFDLQHPQGMTMDPVSGRLFILDSAADRILRIAPGSDLSFDGLSALRDGRISQVDLRPLGLAGLRGLAFNPTNNHLYVFSKADQTLYELTEAGQIVAIRDLAPYHLRDPQALVFAPSGDLTDDPAQLSLYLADSGLTTGGPTPGQLVELSLTEPLVMDLTAVTTPATLVRIIDTSQWSPPSPDPSGIAYLPDSNRLMISDGEVEEMTIYRGVNIYESTLAGSLVDTADTTSFSNEPTGVALNPATRRLFFSDDDRREVYELNPGADGLAFTGDDIVTSFDTLVFGGNDPEGIAFDSWAGDLYIADGLNEEIYRVRPGANGRFDGVPSAGDDEVTHFDTSGMGALDPEGVEFNPDTGNLYITSSDKKVFETTRAGAVVSVIDMSSLSISKLSGAAYAPRSNAPAEKSLYIADRRADNDNNPQENDGRVYEIVVGQPATTPTPSNTPPPSNTPAPSSTPTPTAIPGPIATFITEADAHVKEANPNSNYGTLVSLNVDAGTGVNVEGYLRFTVTGLTGPVQSATLRVFVTTDGTSDGPAVYGTSNNWSETGITWNNRPAPTSGAVDDKGTLGTNAWAEYNVTSLVTGNGTYSFVFVTGSTNGVLFSSREGSSPPQLVVDTASGPTSTPAATATSTPTATNTASPTQTRTPTATGTSPTNTPTSTPSDTPAPTATNTPTQTPTPTNTPTPTLPATETSTPTATVTGAPPTNTPTSTPSHTPALTATSTPTQTPTPTNTPTPTSMPLGVNFYLSLANSGSYTVGAVPSVRDEDILFFDGANFSMFFDGSDVGVGGSDVDAFYIVDANTILISFDTDFTIGALGQVDDSDIVQFEATSLGDNTTGSFVSIFFDGSLVGLETTNEDVDAVELLPDGRLLVSMNGNFTVPGVSGRDEDLAAFTPTTPGDYTSGAWAMYFDGSDVGLSATDIDGVSVDINGDIYLSMRDNFTVPGVSGADEDVFVCRPISLGDNTACTYLPNLFDGSLWGLDSNDLDAIAF